ncbi:RNase H domain-containing protein [Trichonephila clavipes]|nr:RNase H domain-containing protein [Trichonephila clavipes]
MTARNYCAHHNTRDHWTLRCMNRCPDLVVCLKRDLQCLRPEASLVLIYRPNVARMKGRVDLAQPVNRTPDLWENLSASSISNYDCILSPFFIPHPSERNAINIVQSSDKSTEDFPVICYTDGGKIYGRVGFAFVVFRSGVESENFQFRIGDECTVFVAELLCLNFAVKWITEQNSVISEYLICTDSFSSLDLLKCISSSNNIIVDIKSNLKSLRDKTSQ